MKWPSVHWPEGAPHLSRVTTNQFLGLAPITNPHISRFPQPIIASDGAFLLRPMLVASRPSAQPRWSCPSSRHPPPLIFFRTPPPPSSREPTALINEGHFILNLVRLSISTYLHLRTFSKHTSLSEFPPQLSSSPLLQDQQVVASLAIDRRWPPAFYNQLFYYYYYHYYLLILPPSAYSRSSVTLSSHFTSF
jgi:hypothetical protein